jgi:hypothetical protein
MIRCAPRLSLGLLRFGACLAGAVLLFCASAQGQQGIRRDVPADVRLGRLVVTQPPEVTLDGKPERLSPGARIRNTDNLQLLSASVVGQTLPVLYRRDSLGLIHEVWLLTPQEARELGAINTSNAQGQKRFADLLAQLFVVRR